MKRTAMKRTRMKRQAGVTLMELTIAVTLLSLLSVGLLFSFRIGLTAYGKIQTRLMDNRRVAGAQRILEQQLEGLMPVVAPCRIGPFKSPGYGKIVRPDSKNAYSLSFSVVISDVPALVKLESTSACCP